MLLKRLYGPLTIWKGRRNTMTGTMHGVCKMAPGVGAEYREDIPIPQIGKDEVLMRVHAVAICGTDTHIYHWNEYASTRMKNLPMVFGHETSGEIVEIGENVTGYKIGDRITVETHIPCNHCHQCLTDNRHICENMRVFGVTDPGAFAEYAVVPKDCIVRLDDEISYDMGAMMEAMGAGVHGVERAQVAGKTVLVSGCGPIGLMAIGACKVHGAKKVIACDMFDEKLELAKKMGADVTVNIKNEDLINRVKMETDGHGAEAAIDITGNGRAVVSALRALQQGGILVSVGLPNGEVPINLSEDIIYREITYTGISGRRMFETWDDCAQILKTPGFTLEPVLGGIYPLKDFEKAFQAIWNGAPGKMILHP